MHHDLLDSIVPLNRILTALNNFCPPLVSTDAEISCGMLRKAEMGRNALLSRVEKSLTPEEASGHPWTRMKLCHSFQYF